MTMPSAISNGSLSPSRLKFSAGSWKNAPFANSKWLSMCQKRVSLKPSRSKCSE